MAQESKLLQYTMATIAGIAVVGGIFGATWAPGVLLTAVAALIALYIILTKGAGEMNEPGKFGQGLTSVLAALILLPTAITGAAFVGLSIGIADDISSDVSDFEEDFSFEEEDPGLEDDSLYEEENSAYDECMADLYTTVEECEALLE